MKRIHSVLIAGAGAVGAAVAWQINRNASGTASVLAGGERFERYSTKTFEINGEQCSFPLTKTESTTNQDLIIIACKNHHLPQVISDIKNHVGKDTLILSLLNGISSETRIANVYGAHRIPYAMIIGIDAVHEDMSITFSNPGTIFFGDAKNTKPWSPAVSTIAAFFERTGVPFSVPTNMLNRLWYKFMMNVGLNQLSAIMGRPYLAFKNKPHKGPAAELLTDAMREVISVAAHEGVILTEEDLSTVYHVLNKLSDQGKTSMLQDVEAQRKTEVELFAGTVVELAKAHGVSVPINTLMYRLITAIEQSY